MARFQPAVLGGLFIGVLSSLPIVGAANYCCCLWVVTGGLLTVYLQRLATPTVPASPAPLAPAADRNETTEAVLGGLLAGLIGAVIYVGFSVLLFSVTGDAMLAELQAALDRYPQLPPEIRDRAMTMFTGGAFVLVMAAVTIPTYAVFSMLGALLGLALFRKRPTPPAAQTLQS
jgi:hypothetical protein